MADRAASFVAECFWPDVESADVEALDRRILAVMGELGRGRSVRYLGTLLMRADEVVLCQFEGTADDVREVAERAGVPFARILETSRLSVPQPAAPGRREEGRS